MFLQLIKTDAANLKILLNR